MRRIKETKAAIIVAILIFLIACTQVQVTPEPTAELRSSSLGAVVVISQVYGGGGNSGAPFTHDFVELFNRSTAPVSLNGLSVQYTSATGTGNFGANSGQLTELPNIVLEPGQYFLIQQAGGTTGAALPTPDLVDSTPINMSASSGKVALVTGTSSLGCNGGSVDCSDAQLERILDLVGYGSANFFEGSAAAPSLSNTSAAFRASGGCTDTNDNAADFSSSTPAPRNTSSLRNPCDNSGNGDDDDPAVCSTDFTPIYAIQGSGAATPLAGQIVTTQGVVVGDFQGRSPNLRGFYIQDLVGDGDPLTSDGIFVFNGNDISVSLGQVVQVTGTAGEFQDQTQLSNVTAIIDCGTTATIEPVNVTLPFPEDTDGVAYLERYEGMLVRLPQTLYVTEHFQLGRFGQVVMSSGDRLYQPTNITPPGAAALALQAENDRNRIIIDDNLNNQNPDPILFGRGGHPLTASNTLRGGDSATGIVGVMTFTWAGNAASGNAFRVRPVGALGGGVPEFQATNPRPTEPQAVGGSVRVASFNLLNYFNTFSGCTTGVGGAPADCRGADNMTEFDRQVAKTTAAILGLDADVLGLIELENDGHGPDSAIADLVERLNAATAPGTYAFIDADAATGELNVLGTDAIKVGFVYRPATVTPIGQTAVLNTGAFGIITTQAGSTQRNRPALAQSFEEIGSGARFTAVVNHLKSKGSSCATNVSPIGPDPDLGDGQGNCNLTRTQAAQELVAWLATDPTSIGDPDVLIIGDLNAYAMEDPIMAIIDAGYTNLLKTLLGDTAYSYVFDGQWGYLDHTLSSASLTPQVAGITEWHINADEPNVLDYNTNFKSANQIVSLYAPDVFRSSDHDPVLVGLALTFDPATELTILLSRIENLRQSGSLNRGQAIALSRQLEGALAALERSQARVAINRLNAFSQQVQSFIADGILDETIGTDFLNRAAAIQGALN